MQKLTWLDDLLDAAKEFGFSLMGICPAVDAAGFHRLIDWVQAGNCAGMEYFSNRIDAYRNPDGVMPGTKSIIALAYPYFANPSSSGVSGQGRVARYAWSGIDYHDTIHSHFKAIKKLVRDCSPEVSLRGCVDTAPLLERELAELAGLGWRGKNTLLLNRAQGSYFFLACLLVDQQLPYDQPDDKSYCGSCTACLDACPTDAFVDAGILDARKCISYLTIEHRGEIDPKYRDAIGDWVFGCDVCQEVCPWNRKPTRNASPIDEAALTDFVDLIAVLQMDESEFRTRYRKSPFWRTKLQGMQRNAAIVLGNQGCRDAIPVLQERSLGEDPVVAEACRWAIKKIEGE
ncbi:tRNA epoxyqueuosine(34) reductase QueG [Stieleria sp. JC731]|uniref:tRNA epoxyqueuosine(34) reductase QueG n=1 Tax=Pirellulaceae TaxID=2691357 RepID=UPI001E294EB3|nr:tRNA epoxyqueuosine(34) reductase QueG [Stieleria sp. JC731]MCC9603158.1 tRNA epoxyqueuosine(34) reductase QueG [Stieleria sp. JC731]